MFRFLLLSVLKVQYLDPTEKKKMKKTLSRKWEKGQNPHYIMHNSTDNLAENENRKKVANENLWVRKCVVCSHEVKFKKFSLL